MSFSSDVKDEITRLETGAPCCMLAELVAVMGASGTVSLLGGGRMGVYVETEHAPTARRLLLLLRAAFGVQPALRATRRVQLGGRNSYRLSLAGDEAMRVLTACGVLHRDAEGRFFIRPNIPKQALAKKCCRKAFLRGAFMAGGSISNPEKEYHLEFVLADERFASLLCGVLMKFRLHVKKVRRKGAIVVYLKEAEHIVTLLNLLGAYGAQCDLENIRIHKDIRNNVNRVVNCDSANLGKTIDAAGRQVMAIERIARQMGLARLPEPLREIAQARLEHQEASLQELGALLQPPVGKSGVNHRLRRLVAIADALSKQKGDMP
ncbi:MAG: DNA-binding protein WhiA [Oscillospiraceae bacterium]|jgi:DNA-binding protein WhiA|nr:DNA-binding protein WhiA [Oscillospiraceae bacterium]